LPVPDILKVSGLGVNYRAVVGLAAVSLNLAEGEIVVVLGANGAGKTSLLKGIAGLVRPARGSVMIDGLDVTRRPAHVRARNGIALVPEGRRVFAPLTVEENLLLGAYSLGRGARRGSRLSDMYEMFPILHKRRHTHAGMLSGGEQQMLAFGRAVMSNPRAMLMDEPSMGLSPAVARQVFEKAREIAGRGIAVLLAEQNAALAFTIADRGLVLARGEVTLTGSSRELERDPGVIQAFLGEGAAAH
jgi:branched-chain amino acid transport system ATP-binding protein